MNSTKLRIWVLLLMLTACSVVYTTAVSLLPAQGSAGVSLAWIL